MTGTDLQGIGQLLEAAKRGDSEALDNLFARYAPFAVRIAELRIGSRIRGSADAEDIAQESLLEAFLTLDRFQFRSEGALRNWLSRIVENNVRDASRRQLASKRGADRVRLWCEVTDTALSESLFPGSISTPSQHARARELEMRLEETIRGVGEIYREVVLLRNLCAMSYKDIATEMGYAKLSTVRSLHARALEKIRKRLGGDFL